MNMRVLRTLSKGKITDVLQYFEKGQWVNVPVEIVQTEDKQPAIIRTESYWDCEHCNGSGVIYDKESYCACPDCGGEGYGVKHLPPGFF